MRATIRDPKTVVSDIMVLATSVLRLPSHPWDHNFAKAAWIRSLDRRNNGVDLQPHKWPLGFSQNYKRNFMVV